MVCAMCYSGGVLWHGTELNVGDIISIWLGSIWYVVCMVCPGTIWYVSGRLCLGTICMLVVWYVFVQYGIGIAWYNMLVVCLIPGRCVLSGQSQQDCREL